MQRKKAQPEASCLLEFPVLIHVLSPLLFPNLLQNQQSQLFCIEKKSTWNWNLDCLFCLLLRNLGLLLWCINEVWVHSWLSVSGWWHLFRRQEMSWCLVKFPWLICLTRTYPSIDMSWVLSRICSQSSCSQLPLIPAMHRCEVTVGFFPKMMDCHSDLDLRSHRGSWP